MLLELLLVPGLLLFGFITSVEDFHHRRIRNKWVLLALGYAFLSVLIAYLVAAYNHTYQSGYLTAFAINVLFACFAAWMLWYAGLWTAGDAKLFMAYAALMPLSVYQWGTVQYFPSFVMLVNTFAPYFLVYTAVVLWRTSSTEKLEIVKEMLAPKMLLSFILYVFAFYWLISKVAPFLPIIANFFVSMFVLFIIMVLLQSVLKARFLWLVAAISLLAIIIDVDTVSTTVFLKRFLYSLIVFVLLMYFILNLAHRLFSRTVYIEGLKPGMIPAENYYRRTDAYQKRRIVPISLIQGMLDRHEGVPLFKDVSRGMLAGEVEELKQLHSQGMITDHTIRVYSTHPFAPFMLLGAILTLLAKGNLFVWLQMLTEKLL